jgi:hypothetical protein
MERKSLGIISVDFDVTDLFMIIYFTFFKYLKRKWVYSEAVHQLFIDFKKTYDSVRWLVLYILSEFGIPMNLVRLIKMCLNETYSRVLVGKNLSDVSLLRMVWNAEMLFNFALDYTIMSVQVNQDGLKLNITH